MRALKYTVLLALFLLAACQPVTPTQSSENPLDSSAEVEETVAELVEDSPDEPEENVALDEMEVPLPSEPRKITILTEDGVELTAVYWPAAVNPAPIVVLFHQINQDMMQWQAVGGWLQNRGMTDGMAGGGDPWRDPSWFPPVPEDLHVGVIAATYRGCEGGCGDFDPAGWAEDSRSVVAYAASLPESTGQVFTMGTSIGADGAVNGCALSSGVCLGAMPLSPGSYLDRDFITDVTALTGADVPVRCHASTDDGDSAETCESFSGDLYEAVIYDGSAHGIQLVAPEYDLLERLVAFLAELI